MIRVMEDKYSAAHRFGIVADADGRKVGPYAQGDDLTGFAVRGGDANTAAVVSEFAAGGEVIARRVTTDGQSICWLREDLAALAELALQQEAKQYRRAAEKVGEFIRHTDAAGAEREGVTIEQYRRDRLNAGARWEKYRARNRAGGR